MEVIGAVTVFQQSVEKHKLIHESYILDGDTSSFNEVVAANPYKDYGLIPPKLEWICHVEKRMGTRLRELRRSYKNPTTPLSGKGRLVTRL